ncbi:hypothetical protein AMECASPLE_013360 [Ameca splendens]|uniref:Uncharacterized protein n=1 Tax=Ameca splendens TaxID=208324 RepID=A0ABV1A024_9TELE
MPNQNLYTYLHGDNIEIRDNFFSQNTNNIPFCVLDSLEGKYVYQLRVILQSKAIGKPCAAIRDLLECWMDPGAWLQPLISGHALSKPFDSWQRTDDSQARLITAN